MKKIVLLANHNNGYNILNFLSKQKDAHILKVAILEDPKGRWWKSVHELAQQLNLPIIVFTDNNDLYAELKDLDFDLLISASWRAIVPKKILDLPKIGAVNMHNSLLPKYRGSYANAWPILKGDIETGASLHWMTEKFDDGEIIAQVRFPIEPWQTAREVWETINKHYLIMFKNAWKKVDDWKTISRKQTGKPSFFTIADFNKINEIDLNKQIRVRDFINFLRAKTFEPYYRNAYFIDPKTKKKIFISINLSKEK